MPGAMNPSADVKKADTMVVEDLEAMKKSPLEEPVLLFGKLTVAPKMVLNMFLIGYAVFFVVYRLADIVYLFDVDAKFPAGLGYLYPSEHERMQSVDYTRRSIKLTMMSKTASFVLVMALVLSGAIVKFDDFLRNCLSRIASFGGEGGVPSVVGRYLGGLLTWASGGCCCSLAGCFCGLKLNWSRLLRGTIYLSAFATLFFAVSIPVKLWLFDLNVEYGFINTLTVTPEMYRSSLWYQLKGTFSSSLTQFFFYLMVLQWRFGWLFMWAGLITMAVVAQYNMGVLAPMLFDARNAFPSSEFGVAHDFPLSYLEGFPAGHVYPHVSLNRIFYPDEAKKGTYVTNDKSKGEFQLATTASEPGAMGKWVIRSKDAGPTSLRYAESATKSTFLDSAADLEHLEHQAWNVGGKDAPDARLSVRKGDELRKELYDFAKSEGVGVGQVYMIDGSHQDARANAFVAGAGKERVIGLYDTLFLGNNASQGEEESALEAVRRPPSSADGGVPIQLLSEAIQAVDASEEDETPVYRSAATTAMSDTEIMAILAHEMGHAKMKDVEQNILVQAATSFATFATLGWMVQSPVLAASMTLAYPIGHVAVFLFDHVTGPVLEGGIKLMTDGLTRQKEYVADAYAARVSESYATGLQTALAKLTVNSNQDPDEPWFYEALHADHPTFAHRWEVIQKVKDQEYKQSNDVVKKSLIQRRAQHNMLKASP